MRHICYEVGPDFIEVGTVGRIERGKPVDVSEEVAAKLLKKTSIVFKDAGKKKEG